MKKNLLDSFVNPPPPSLFNSILYTDVPPKNPKIGDLYYCKKFDEIYYFLDKQWKLLVKKNV